ncbi:hypothetical protein [Streptomyces olivaceus]|uniref:hypothetical protein n=1 Tax=Streptomyces olivaceus TaxID=47716 RepID=UPI0022ED865E|nr:hypothetical protein [Streptomyces olivaceus]GHI91739.1 hypothetical protein TPA0905_12100 [Streptomyces olivaceus]
MACNCGGRSGARATRTGNTPQGTYWRHTDQYGGIVPYWDEDTARAALNRTRGQLQKVDRTGRVVETIPYTDPAKAARTRT